MSHTPLGDLESDKRDFADPRLVNAREVLAKAEAEISKRARAESKLPDRPLVTGVVSFLFDPAAALSWGAFTFWGHVLLSLLWGAFHFADAGLGQIISIALVVLLAMLSFPFVLWFSSSCLAITRDTANGHRTIAGWPGLDVTDCLSDAPFMLLCLSAAALPGYLVGQAALMANAPVWVLFPTCGTTLLGLYPVVLLSTVKSGSPLAMLSRQVLQSMSSLSGAWCRFYLLSACLGSLVVFTIWLNWIAGVILGLLPAAPLIAAVMVYHRLIGRLAWVIEEKAPDVSDS